MRLFYSMAAGLLLLIVLATAGCSNRQAANNGGKGNSSGTSNARNNTPPDNIRRVTVQELRDLLDQGKAVVVDVRGTMSYEQEHIKGAVDLPEGELTRRAGELPKDKLLVFYCS